MAATEQPHPIGFVGTQVDGKLFPNFLHCVPGLDEKGGDIPGFVSELELAAFSEQAGEFLMVLEVETGETAALHLHILYLVLVESCGCHLVGSCKVGEARERGAEMLKQDSLHP